MPNQTNPPAKDRPPPPPSDQNAPPTSTSSAGATRTPSAAPKAPYKPMNTLNSTTLPSFAASPAPAFGQSSPMRSNLQTGSYIAQPPPPLKGGQRLDFRAAFQGGSSSGNGLIGRPAQPAPAVGGYREGGNGMGQIQSRDPFMGGGCEYPRCPHGSKD